MGSLKLRSHPPCSAPNVKTSPILICGFFVFPDFPAPFRGECLLDVCSVAVILRNRAWQEPTPYLVGLVRAENLIHGSDQYSCSSGALPVMLTGHVPAVRVRHEALLFRMGVRDRPLP